MPGKVTDDRSTPPRHVNDRVVLEATVRKPVRTKRSAPRDSSSAFDGPIRRLYTVRMMADVLGVPMAAVRHWQRGGLLEPTRRVGALEWFDFQQLVVGRQLARLLAAGFSLREIDAKLAGLSSAGAAAAARAAGRIVVDGRRLSIRRENRLLGAGGQMQLAFYAEHTRDDDDTVAMPLTPATTGMPSRDSSIDIALDDDALIGQDLRAAAWTNVTTSAGAPLPTGLGWFVQTYNGERLIWQFGAMPNVGSALLLKVPSRDITLILLANSEGLAPDTVANGDITVSLFARLFLRLFVS